MSSCTIPSTLVRLDRGWLPGKREPLGGLSQKQVFTRCGALIAEQLSSLYAWPFPPHRRFAHTLLAALDGIV